MVKTSLLNRQKRRQKLVPQHAERRAALKAVIRDPRASLQDKMDAYKQLLKLPRDSSPVRLRNRCNLTGRGRAYYRRFGVSRLMLRQLAHRGELPGVKKASW